MIRKNIVIVMNYQWNYFDSRGSSFMGPRSETISIRIRDFVSSLDYKSWTVLQTRDTRSPEDNFYAHQKTQCVVGTSDLNMVEGLGAPNPLIIPCTRPAATYRTQLLKEVHKYDPDRIVLIGAETHSAIMFTAHELKMLSYEVTIIEPLTTSRDEHMHYAAISILNDAVGIRIADRL